MSYFYRFLSLSILTSGWIFSTCSHGLVQINVDDWVDFIPPREAIANPQTVGGNQCPCLKYPQEDISLMPLIPKLSNVLKQSISNKRSSCHSLSLPITNLLKRCSHDLQSNPHRGGLTGDSLPSFFVYLPKTTATVGDFLLIEHLDNGGLKELYYNQFPLPIESGIVRIPSPIALEAEKTYEWHFAIICDSGDPREVVDRSTDAVAVGTVKRIALSPQLQSRIDRASPITKLKIYGEMGLWYDFFALLTENQQRSRILREVWQTILKQEFGQDSTISQSQLLSCCSTVTREE